MNDPEVEQAILRVQTGSVDDYRTVVAAYHRRLRMGLAGFCPPRVEPDEIAHIAFLEAFRRIAQYRPGTDFFAWLCAFARNLVRAECEKFQRLARNNENYLEEVLAGQQASVSWGFGAGPGSSPKISRRVPRPAQARGARTPRLALRRRPACASHCTAPGPQRERGERATLRPAQNPPRLRRSKNGFTRQHCNFI